MIFLNTIKSENCDKFFLYCPTLKFSLYVQHPQHRTPYLGRSSDAAHYLNTTPQPPGTPYLL